jgi:predicted nucleic acid-binding protein
MLTMPELALRYRHLAARDLIHVATCLEAGIGTIVSPDRGFDAVDGLARVAPDDAHAIAAHVR